MAQDKHQARPWLFYGRAGGPGHYLWTSRLAVAVDPRGQHPHPLSLFDRVLCRPFGAPYVAALTRLGAHGYSALAWWEGDVPQVATYGDGEADLKGEAWRRDYEERMRRRAGNPDIQPGDNCILFGPDLRLSPTVMLRAFARRFPSIANRMPEVDVREAELQHAEAGVALDAIETRELVG